MLGTKDQKKNHGPKQTECEQQDKNVARTVMDHKYQGGVRLYTGVCNQQNVMPYIW